MKNEIKQFVNSVYGHVSEEYHNKRKVEREMRASLSRYLRILKSEYTTENKNVSYDLYNFLMWIEQKYGIRPYTNNDGQIIGQYDIIDEDKHLFLILKHGK